MRGRGPRPRVLAGWLTPFDRVEVAVGVVGALLASSSVSPPRITDWDAARAANAARSPDVLTTSLEFTDETDETHLLIQRRAEEVVATATPGQAIPIKAEPSSLKRLALTLAAAMAFALLPPLGGSPALSADHASAIEEEAEKVEEIAEAVKESGVEGSEEIAEELERLARELRQAKTLQEAMELLDRTDATLEAKLDPTFLAQKAAAQGLAQDLTLRPLTPNGGPDAALQLEQLARELEGMSEQERQAAIDRCASSPSPRPPATRGSPASSQGLRTRQRRRRAGAREALRAAGNQRSGLDAVRGQQAAAEASRALDGSFLSARPPSPARVRAARRRGGPGQGQGQGQGQGRVKAKDRARVRTRRSERCRWRGRFRSHRRRHTWAGRRIGPGRSGNGRWRKQGDHGTGVGSTVFKPVDRGESPTSSTSGSTVAAARATSSAVAMAHRARRVVRPVFPGAAQVPQRRRRLADPSSSSP